MLEKGKRFKVLFGIYDSLGFADEQHLLKRGLEFKVIDRTTELHPFGLIVVTFIVPDGTFRSIIIERDWEELMFGRPSPYKVKGKRVYIEELADGY